MFWIVLMPELLHYDSKKYILSLFTMPNQVEIEVSAQYLGKLEFMRTSFE